MTDFIVKVNFFGTFRKYGDHGEISLPAGSRVGDLKSLLEKELSGRGADMADARLVHDSAVACNDTIVDAHHQIKPDETVSILPPVCGG